MVANKFLALSEFVDCHRNIPAVIVGSAPDISSFPYQSFPGLVFGMGDSPLRGIGMFQTDYWVFANAHWIRPWIQRDAAAIKFVNPRKTFIATSIFSLQAPETVINKLDRTLQSFSNNLIFFDQRHSTRGPSCSPSKACCLVANLLGIEHTIQELLSMKFNQTAQYSQGATVALHALSLAILMGCNPISIIGVKIPQIRKDYSYFRTPAVDELVKRFGSLGPYVKDDRNLFYAQLIHNAKSLVNPMYRMLQRKFYPIVRGKKLDLAESVFVPDRAQIKADFEFIISNYLRIGGEVRNYSSGSLLSEIAGVLSVEPT